MPTSVAFIGNDLTFEVTGTPRGDSPMLILHYSASSFPVAANTQTVIGNFPVLGVWSAFLLSGFFDNTPTDFNIKFFLQNSGLITVEKSIQDNKIRFYNESTSFSMRLAGVNSSNNSFLFYMGFEQVFIPPLQLEILSDEPLTIDKYIVYSASASYNIDVLRERPGIKIPYSPTKVC